MAAFKRDNGIISAGALGTMQPHLVGHVLLTSLQQAQQHKMSADVAEGEVVCLRGPLDLVKWRELHVGHDAIRAALIRAALVPTELLVTEAYLLNHGQAWNPVLELWADESQGDGFDIQKIHAVVEAVLAGLHRDAINDIEDLCEVSLDPVERHAVHQVVQETLAVIGGRRLSVPVHVHVHASTFSLSGKLGRKKSRLNLHPSEESFSGQFLGIDIDPPELRFQADQRTIRMCFARPVVDLKAVLDAMLAGEQCEVRTQKTIAENGREVHTYQPDGAFRLPDYLTECSPIQGQTDQDNQNQFMA
jgi:hypothetical protein